MNAAFNSVQVKGEGSVASTKIYMKQLTIIFINDFSVQIKYNVIIINFDLLHFSNQKTIIFNKCASTCSCDDDIQKWGRIFIQNNKIVIK